MCLDNKPKNFYAGKISKFFHNWTKLTKDKFILNVIQEGYEIEFESEPCINCNRKPINFNIKEQNIISDLLKKFEDKGVIVESQHELGEILSNIFIRPKQDGTYRLILNLSRLKAIAIDSRLSPAKVRWRQPAVSSELSLVTAS